jgi:hypothetical protein
MFRFLLYLMPSLARELAWFFVFAVVIAGLLMLAEVPPRWAVGMGLVCFALPCYSHGRLLGRFVRATWRFRTAVSGSLVLRYAPELHGRIDLEHCFKRSSDDLAQLSQTLDVTLQRCLVIYLFPTAVRITSIFRYPCGGFALPRGDAIAVSADQRPDVRLDEVILHEMAHLFSARLGKLAPPFKSEGLATWLMNSIDGKPIDFHALATLLAGRYIFFTWLKKTTDFYRIETSYILAGSFTGDLIRRFGWDRYREFFRRTTSKNFEQSFAQVFGLSLMKAEHQWREDLLARRQTFEPELSTFLAERSIVVAYESGQLYRCLQEIDVFSRAGQISGKVLSYAAAAHLYLGHYREAIAALEQALQSEEVWVRSNRSALWLPLGNAYDLLGARAKAEQAYQRALAEIDPWTGSRRSTHPLARRFLKQPFTEHDLQARLLPTGKGSRGQR